MMERPALYMEKMALHAATTGWPNPHANQKKIYAADNLYEPIYLRVITSHFALLDHFVKVGRLPYKTLQWTLSNDLDLAGLQAQIYEQTGKLPIPSSGVSTSAPTSIEYRIYDEHKNHGVKVSFSSQTPRSPARIRLTRDTTLDGTFYRAHELFSVRTILSILRGEIPYKQVAQLVVASEEQRSEKAR